MIKCVSKIMRPILIGLVGLCFVSFFPSSASAIPAFARKYVLNCTVCHTKPPRLNPFGEAFNLNGYQIPATFEGEIKKKEKVGHVFLEKELRNIFAMRFLGNFLEGFDQGRAGDEVHLAFPHELELFFAGTLTQEISFFIEVTSELPSIGGNTPEGTQNEALFSENTDPSLKMARSFLIFNLGAMTETESQKKRSPSKKQIIIGPMIRVGHIDPSTFFPFPLERQYFKAVPGRVRGTRPLIFSLQPYALSSKFFGMRTTSGKAIEVTKPVLYNGQGYGIDLHARVGAFIFQTGILQGLDGGPRDTNAKKDPYLMARYDFGGERFFSGNIAAFSSWGFDTGKVENDLIDWFRYGLGGNLHLGLLDIYGSYVEDEIKNIPIETRKLFDNTASGLSLEVDYLVTNQVMMMARYDQLQAGGFLDQKGNGALLSLQIRYYIRDNLGIYLRNSTNLKGISANPLQAFRTYYAFGVDFDW